MSLFPQWLVEFLPKFTQNHLDDLLRLLSQWLNQPKGMYEVLTYKAELELFDEGRKATYHKEKKVKFLQDNIIAYQDLAWGDGEIFAEYKCSPGVAVDRYLEGDIYNILISLRETKNRGDVEEFFIKRTIRNGFTKDREYFQNIINHPMRSISISVIFPKGHHPKKLALLERDRNRVTLLGAEHVRTLPDGRQKVIWETHHPHLHELYSIRWDW